jgi:hypothetical protein
MMMKITALSLVLAATIHVSSVVSSLVRSLEMRPSRNAVPFLLLHSLVDFRNAHQKPPFLLLSLL